MRNGTKMTLRFQAILLVFGLSLFFMASSLFAQVAGDYRTVATGGALNWSSIATWERYDGAAWQAATAYPGQTSGDAQTVTILSTGDPAVTLDVSPANSIVNLVVQSGLSTELDMNANSLIVSGDVTLDGDIDGSTLGLSTLQVGGNFTVNSTATWDAGGNGISITFNGAGTQTISGTYSTALSFYNFTINGLTVDNNLSADYVISGQFLLQAGTFLAGTSTFILNNGSLGAIVFYKTGGTFTCETSTFKINSSQNVYMSTDADITFYNIIHEPTGLKYLYFDETNAAGAVYTITNSLEINPYSYGVDFLNGASMAYSGTTTLSYTTGNNITIGLEWPAINGPTNVTINSSATYTLEGSRTISGTLTKAGAGIFQLSGGYTLTVAVGGTFDLNGGTFDLVDATNFLTVSGTLNMGGGTLTLNGGTLTYNAGSILEYSVTMTAGDEWGPALTVYNVTVQSGTVTLAAASGARTIQTDLTVTGALTANDNALSVGGALTVNGTLTTSNVSISVTGNATLGASASVGTGGGAFSAGGTCYLTSSSALTTSGGTVGVTGNTTLEGSAQISSGAGDITLQADVALGYLSKLTTTANAYVYGNLTISGGATVDDGLGTGGTLVMGGSSTTAVNIDGTITVFNFTVNKTGGSTVLVNSVSGSQFRFNANGTLYIQEGILSLSSTSLILDTAGGSISDDNITLKIDDLGTLKTGGVDITGFAVFTLADNSTIEFNGASAEAVPAATLGDVTISNTYATGVNLSGNITLQTNSNVTVNSGSRLNLQGYTITHPATNLDALDVSGDLYTDGTDITGFNTYTIGGTVIFNGLLAETVPAAVTFTNLTVNNSAGISLGGTATVTGILTFTSGTITSTSVNLLTLGVSATATPTSTSFVIGPVARQTDGVATSYAFPVGIGTSLRKVTLAFSAAPTASTTITVEAKGVATGATSTITDIKSVEDDGYWTISTGLTSIPSYTATFTTTNFSPAIAAGSSVTMVRGTNPNYNDEEGSSPSTATDQVTASFVTGTAFGDYAVGNLRTTFTWDGGASDGLWSSAANWVGDALPQTGDVILFDNSVASSYTVEYDASVVPTEFYSITISPTTTVSLTLTKAATLNLTNTTSPLVVGNGGTLIFNGTSLAFGGSAYNASLTDFQTGSTVQYNSLVGNYVQSDTYYNLILNLSSVGEANGAIVVNNNLTNQGTAAFTAGGDITVTGNFTNSGEFDFPSAQIYAFSVSGTTTNSGTVTLSSTGTVTLTGPVTLSAGTFTPNSDTHIKAGLTGSGGTFSTTAGTVIFDGAAAQTIDGATNLSFYNFTLNNANGLTLSQNPTVEGTLTFTSGLINTGAYYITVGANGSATGGSSASYVNGRMQKVFTALQAGSFTFDTGKGGEYLPVSIAFTDVDLTYTVAVEQYNSDPHLITSTIDAATLSAISIVRYWLVDGTGGTPTSPQVTLTWNSNDGVSNLTALDVAQYDGTQWTSIGGDGVGTATSGTIQSATMVSGGNYFTFGDDAAGGQDNSLPVELASFEAAADYGKVTLNWSTASEVNNQGFNVYRKNNATQNWQQLNADLIPGQGNSSQETNYTFVDERVNAGATYIYKLESVSMTGLRVEEKTIEVAIPVPTDYALLNNYPNPFNPTTHLRFRLPEAQRITLSIYNMRGQLIKHLIRDAEYTAGEYEQAWDATDMNGRRVSSGMYLYVFKAGAFQKVGKMVLLK